MRVVLPLVLAAALGLAAPARADVESDVRAAAAAAEAGDAFWGRGLARGALGDHTAAAADFTAAHALGVKNPALDRSLRQLGAIE